MNTLQKSGLCLQWELTLPEELIEENIGFFPWVLGENMAGMVDSYINENGLGYYPAMDFFRDKEDVVDPSLLLLIDELAYFAVLYSKRSLHHRLLQLFSAVSIERAICTAYSMPPVRPSRANAPGELARFYSPKRVRIELRVYGKDESLKQLGEKGLTNKMEALVDDLFDEAQVLTCKQIA